MIARTAGKTAKRVARAKPAKTTKPVKISEDSNGPESGQTSINPHWQNHLRRSK